MKKIIIGVVFSLALGGCATANYSTGNDFNGDAVASIHRGQTTTDDLLKAFGQPFSKTLVSENQERWVYMYSTVQSHAQSLIFTMQVETTGSRKYLEILIKNGVVENYTYSNSPLGNMGSGVTTIN